MIWHDITWHDIPWHDTTLLDMTLHDMTRHCLTWHYMTWHDIAWHDITLHDTTLINIMYLTLHEMTVRGIASNDFIWNCTMLHDIALHDIWHVTTLHDMHHTYTTCICITVGISVCESIVMWDHLPVENAVCHCSSIAIFVVGGAKRSWSWHGTHNLDLLQLFWAADQDTLYISAKTFWLAGGVRLLNAHDVTLQLDGTLEFREGVSAKDDTPLR